MSLISLITTVKNRKLHFINSFPFLLTQYGTNYELIVVDFGSTDDFKTTFNEQLNVFKPICSKYLKTIKYVHLKEDLAFNPRKAKNLGASYASGNKLAFSDADTLLSMNYLYHHSLYVLKGESFFSTRIQESRANLPSRISPEINYGNIIVEHSDFNSINGWDESVSYYGGDDDDLYHRLKLKGLREINPLSANETFQYSILHDDKLRFELMEDKEKKNCKKAFDEIYNERNFYNKNASFLNHSFQNVNISVDEIVF